MARDAAEFTRTARALQDVPLAHMVEAGALGVIEAQCELDKRTIDILRQMGDPKNGPLLGGRQRSLLELGLTPTFYQFTEATFTFIIDITVQESEDFSISATFGAAAGDKGLSDALAPRSGAPPGGGTSSRPATAPPGGGASTPAAEPATRPTSSATSRSSAGASSSSPSSSSVSRSSTASRSSGSSSRS